VSNASILFAVGTYVEFYVALNERSPWGTLFFAAILAFLSYAAASRRAQRDSNCAHFKLVRRAVGHPGPRLPIAGGSGLIRALKDAVWLAMLRRHLDHGQGTVAFRRQDAHDGFGIWRFRWSFHPA